MCEYAPTWITAIATVVYAIITICILCANRRSANAAKEQIEELKKQTSINSGLQLYEKRRAVLENMKGVSEAFYNDHVCRQLDVDVKMLFDETIQKQYLELKGKSEAIGNIISPEEFKSTLKESDSKTVEHLEKLEKRKNDGYLDQVSKEYEEVCNNATISYNGEEYTYKQVLDCYEENVKDVKATKQRLISMIEEFIKKSIS